MGNLSFKTIRLGPAIRTGYVTKATRLLEQFDWRDRPNRPMDLLGWITTLLTVGFFISGVYDEPLAIPAAHVPIRLPLRRVRKSRSVGDLSFYPFAATYVK